MLFESVSSETPLTRQYCCQLIAQKRGNENIENVQKEKCEQEPKIRSKQRDGRVRVRGEEDYHSQPFSATFSQEHRHMRFATNTFS